MCRWCDVFSSACIGGVMSSVVCVGQWCNVFRKTHKDSNESSYTGLLCNLCDLSMTDLPTLPPCHASN